MIAEYSFGAWVRRRRRTLDLTQSALARRVGCATITIQKIEADERHPSRQVAELLADQLAIPAGQRAAFIAAARAEQPVDTLPEAAGVSSEAAIRPAPALPDGVLTFLFTDIEGSTAFWERHPQAMAAAQERHDVLLHAAVNAHHGQVFKTVGDGVCAVFARARDALDAAIAAQGALQAEPWPTDAPLQVRMAVHSGGAQRQGDDYLGLTLSRVQRLLVTAHGGQIVCSRAAYELLVDTLPSGVTLRDLGVHTLKDLSRAEQVFQVVAPDLPQDFPPLRSADERRARLPAPPTPLIGRERELAELVTLLQRPEVRLVTLTGAGGSGKTRLALAAAAELADNYADGAVFVDLAPVRDPQAIASAMVRSLGVTELPGSDPAQTLMAYLRRRELLLLLDNLEQVVDGAPLLAELLAAAPGLTLLATSRAPLQLRAEQLFAVPPLAVPPLDASQPTSAQAERLTQYDAVRLFIERGQAVRPGFAVTNANAPAVAEICRRLDGLPLAIELAAARLRLFTPEALLAQLGGVGLLATLGGGPRDLPERQRTLRAAIAWSYELLRPAEQALLARLSVFAGGFGLDAVTAVAEDPLAATEPMVGQGRAEAFAGAINAAGQGASSANASPLRPTHQDPAAAAAWVADGMAALLDHHLARPATMEGDIPRFTLLATVREFAAERLAARGETEAIRDRHLAYYVTLAEAAEPKLRGREQQTWLARLEAEDANIDAALGWAAIPGDNDLERRSLGLRLAAALWYDWYLRGRFEASWRALQALHADDEHLPVGVRARAYAGAWYHLSIATGYTASEDVRQKALTLAQQASDDWSLALALACPTAGQHTDDIEEAENIAKRSFDPWLIAEVLCHAAVWGDETRREIRLLESERLARTLGDLMLLEKVLMWHGWLLRAQGKLELARVVHEEQLALVQQQYYYHLRSGAFVGLGRILEEQGDLDTARAYQIDRLAAEHENSNTPGIVATLLSEAELAIAQGNYSEAAALLNEARAQQYEQRSVSDAYWLLATGDTTLALARGAYAQAALLATEMLPPKPDVYACLTSQYRIGAATAAQGDLSTAHAHYTAALQLFAETTSSVLHWHVGGPGDFSDITLSLVGLAHVALWRYDPEAALAWLDEQHALIANRTGIGVRGLARGVRERVLIAGGRYTEAAEGLVDALEYFRRAGARPRLAGTLELAGMALAATVKPAQAARIWGAAAALRETLGSPMWPVDKPDYEQRVAAARTTCDPESWDAAWQAGRALEWPVAANEAIHEMRDELLWLSVIPA